MFADALGEWQVIAEDGGTPIPPGMLNKIKNRLIKLGIPIKGRKSRIVLLVLPKGKPTKGRIKHGIFMGSKMYEDKDEKEKKEKKKDNDDWSKNPGGGPLSKKFLDEFDKLIDKYKLRDDLEIHLRVRVREPDDLPTMFFEEFQQWNTAVIGMKLRREQ